MTTNNAVNTTLSGQTGTGSFVGSISPTLVTPALGTPTSGNIINTTNGGGVRSFQIFTSGTAATYTKPANVTSILIELVGGGGGGAGSNTTSTAQICVGSGGAAGGYARLYVASAASTYTYTVGAAGSAGSIGGNGGTGGTTSFPALFLQATGGGGGFFMTATSTLAAQSVTGGFGGTGSNGNVNTSGAPGMWGLSSLTAEYPGNGGNSYFAGGGGCQLGGAGLAGSNGSGGGGGATNQNSTGNVGGAGGAGLIIVWEFS
jgi:hypothetical protein